MFAFVSEFAAQMKGIWARLDGGQRTVVGSVMFAGVVGLLAIFWYAGQPDFEEIYSGERISEAQEALAQEGIAVVRQGRSLKVERDQFGDASFILNREGIFGSAGAGFSQPLGGLITDRDSRQHFLAEERRRTAEEVVRALDDVLDVKVTASKPKQSPFRSEDAQNRPSATASIRLRAGANFYQVAPHVASQVASATGIPMQYVTVMDSRSHQTWVEDPDTESGANMDHFLALQKAMSDDRTRRAQWALDRVYPGKTLVMVNVELDNNWERRQEKLFPAEPVVKSDKQSESKTENGVRSAGDPGVAAGSGQSTGAPAGTPVNTSRDETRDRIYDTEAGERTMGKLAPDIKRITSAVFIDASLDAEQSTIIAILEPIIGRDPARGDPETIPMVAEFPLSESLDMPVASSLVSAPGLLELLREWGPTIGQVLGVLLVLLFLRGLLKRAAPVARADHAAAATANEPPAEEAAKQVRTEIEKAIADDPAAISRLLESWLAEQKA